MRDNDFEGLQERDDTEIREAWMERNEMRMSPNDRAICRVWLGLDEPRINPYQIEMAVAQ